jgi:uncharacterized protein YdaU (DUF1376 family)
MHYYQFNIGDYASHTKGLSLLEDLAYRRLLDHYYLAEQPFNGRSTDVARLIGMREYVDEVDYVLRTFFTQDDAGNWRNTRADEEIQAYKRKSENASKAGKRSAAMRSNERSTDVEHSLSERQLTNNHKPITNNQIKDIAPPDGVLDSVWQDFVKHRKQKKAAITETALKGIDREARKAGISLNDALQEICSRGWTGFKAEWVKVKENNLSFAERDEQARRKRWEEMTGRKWTDSNEIDVTPSFLEIEQ